MRLWLALLLVACGCGDDGTQQSHDPVVTADAGATAGPAGDAGPSSGGADAEQKDPTDPYEPY